jgi:carotenoid cleavage dioxygenase-like enzyme
MHEIDSTTIETCSKFNAAEHLPVVSHCAHPIILPDGTILNVGLASGLTGMNYVLFEFPGTIKRLSRQFLRHYLGFSNSNLEDNLMNQCKTLAKIPSRWPFNPAYMHAFAVTDNYILLIEQSLCISLAKLIQLTITHGPMTDALIWHGNEPVCPMNLHSENTKILILFLGSISSY